MGIFKRSNNSLIDLIEWDHTEDSAIVYHFPHYQNKFAYGAKLIVQENQTVIITSNNKVTDVFSEGSYDLINDNLPKLSKLQNWNKESKLNFFADIYFFNSKERLNLSWGKSNLAINIEQDKFIIDGNCLVKITKPEVFLKRVIENDGSLDIEQMCESLVDKIYSSLIDILKTSPDLCTADIASNQLFISDRIKNYAQEYFYNFGLVLESINIDTIKKIGSLEVNESQKDDIANKINIKEYKLEESSDITISQDIDNNKEDQHELPKIYYLMIFGERVGPLNINEVYKKVETEEIDGDTLCWHKGQPGWSELKHLLKL